MVFTGGALIPHGAMLLDPKKEGLPDGAVELHEKTAEMARQIVGLDVGLVVLVTPHGFCLEDDLAVYWSLGVRGSAEWKGDWADVAVDLPLSRKRSNELLNAWKADGVKVQSLNAFSGGTCPLGWAEVIPLWLLQQAGYQGDLVLVSIPHSRTRDRMAIEPRHVDNYHLAGETLARYCDGDGMWKDERVFLAVSGDLAHTHPTSCTDPLFLPDPRSNFPQNGGDAAEFDRRLEQWALDRARGRSLATRCLELDRTALSCGLCGCLLLEGALHHGERRGEVYAGRVLVRRTPTYFTMMSCLFTR